MSYTDSLFSLKGKQALVTGATSGIGEHLAVTLARAGASVILQGRNEDKLKQSVERAQIQLPNGEFSVFKLDLTDTASIEEGFTQALKKFERLDILINSAGVNLREPWQDISIESWKETVDLNLSAPFFVSRACLPFMVSNSYGRIINIASLQSERAFPNSIPYGASKGGIPQLTRAMAEAWSSKGITCNAIAPGFFPTPLTAPVFNDPAKAKNNADKTAIGRNGLMNDLDGLAIFLSSSASSYITGQTIFVDGGFTAK